MLTSRISPAEARRKFLDEYVLCRRLLTARRTEHAQRFPNLACFAFDMISAEIIVFGRFERQLLDLTFEFLAPLKERFSESCALDVGANIGNHALYFSERFLKVYAVEASPKTFDLLTFNAKYFGNNNVYSICSALGDTDRWVSFAEQTREVGCSGVVDGHSDTNTAEILRLQLEVGDALIAKRLPDQPISLIKIDVEGSEYHVVRGLRDTISKNNPVIILEQNADAIVSGTTETLELLRSVHGYKWFFHVETQGNARNRYIRLAHKLFFGELLAMTELHRLDGARHYPQIVCLSQEHASVLQSAN